MDGNEGIDTVSYAGVASAVNVSLTLQGIAQNTGAAGLDTLLNFENITGSSHDDTLEGDAGNNVIDGGASGMDYVSYANATSAVTIDLSIQGSAQNTIGAGLDTLENIDGFIGTDFNDTILGSSIGSFYYDGGLGSDTADFSLWNNPGLDVDLSITTAQSNPGGTNTFISIENFMRTRSAEHREIIIWMVLMVLIRLTLQMPRAA